MEFSEKVVIVTGASRYGEKPGESGIGVVIAKEFAKRGAKVVLFDLCESPSTYPLKNLPRKEDLFETVSKLRDLGYEVFGICGDVSSKDDVVKAVKKTVSKFGRLDILVNNAGICVLSPAIEMSEEIFDLSLRIMAKGTFLFSQAASKVMMNGKRGGRIINISSIIGRVPYLFCTAYAAAKSAIIGITKVMALELAPHNINVNAICPGFIETPLLSGKDGVFSQGARLLNISEKKQKRILLNQIPKGRFGEPRDVAGLCLFLASDEADFITGQAIAIDGGLPANI